MARFEREAKLLASLNHANIATLYGLEESNGQQFLVMELVEGETLAERIARGPIPIDEAIPLFLRIAEGLEAAHEKGIIHRDLKPANIKITPEGKIKILDFGLAKAFLRDEDVSAATSQSPTLTKGTAFGAIMGTASYMSPEQARGKTVDKRTDIWAFGCCLYEALTGYKAFHGETVTDTISAVVRAEPDWKKLPATLPSNVRHVMRLCLRKAPATRLRDIGDARLLLDESPPTPTESETSERHARSPMWTVILAVLGGALVLVAGWGAWYLKPAAPTRVSRFKISLPPGSLPYITGNLALSDDGTLLAYVAGGENTRQVFIHRMDRVDSVRLEGAVDAHEVLLSPDASTVAFFTAETNLTIKKIDLDNLTVTEVGEGLGYIFGATWAPDGTIYFATSAMGLQSLPGGSNTVVRVAPGVLNGRITQPNTLPDSDWILLQLGGFDLGQETAIAGFSPSTQEIKTLVEGGTNPHYAESGHLVFHRGGSLLAVAFDREHLETSGEPVPVLPGVHTDPFGDAEFDISLDGTLAYVPAQQAPKKSLVWVDRSGSIDGLLPEPKSYLLHALSPDGERVAVSLDDENGSHIWVYELDRGVLTRFTFERRNHNPHWSPDGKSILFCSFRGGLPCNRLSMARVRLNGSLPTTSSPAP